MAGDWIKMRTDLWNDPRVVRIMSACKADTCPVIGGLFRVWCLGDTYSVDGSLLGYTPKIIDEAVGIAGFADAMAAVGWLNVTSEGVVIPRFTEHNGRSAKRRAADASRKKRVRKTSASNADTMRTREEKRREDSTGSTNVEPVSPHPSDVAPETPSFQFSMQSGSQWTLPAKKLGEYRDTYRTIDLEAELKKARQWLLDNPDRRPRARMAAFLTRWLNRASESSRTHFTSLALFDQSPESLDEDDYAD